MGYVIGVLLWSLIWGFVTKHISESKGYYGGFAWGFWLGLIGLIVVACKPNVSQTYAEYRPMYPEALPASTPKWTCACGSKNSGSYCYSCRRTREEAKEIAAKKIACPHCGASNNETNVLCFACNQPMREAPTPQPITVHLNTAQQTAESGSVSVSSDDTDVYSALEKLYALFERGILTEAEYAQKKAKLLEKM